MNSRLAVERRAQLLLRQMTLEEKFWQLYMAPGDPVGDSAWRHGAFGIQLLDLRLSRANGFDPRPAASRSNDVQRAFVERTRLGIPAIQFEEGVHGLMQFGATVFPQAIALAATWDTALVGRVAAAIAAESRERGVRQLLSPVVNLARDPRWGRVEETYGEDSWLSAAMGDAFAGALERAGVVATPKHFVVNHGDGGRDSYPVSLDAATLEDLHFPPFRATIRAGARSVMASYNSINGVPATASRDLLTRTLRGAWGFGGVVIADQGGVGGANVLHHTTASYGASTAEALRAGLDVIFQGGANDAPLFWPAFRDQLVPRAVVDTAVMRVLRMKFALGLFDKPYIETAPAGGDAALQARMDSAHALATRAAGASVVLLRNERGILPIAASVLRIAVIGQQLFPPGGYSVPAARVVTLAGALNARRGAADTVLWAPGPALDSSAWTQVPASALAHDSAGRFVAGLRGEYFANPELAGAPATVRTDAEVGFLWTFNRPARGLGTDWYSVRWTGSVDVPQGESVRLAVEGDDGFTLWVDDMLMVDADRKTSFSLRAAPIVLAPGRHAVRLEYRQTTGTGRLRLLWNRRAGASDERLIADAVALARRADVAVLNVGVVEGEFQDRSSLRLPGRQEELIARVAATETPVVVVIASGGAVIPTPWLERVGAVLQVFYPGQGGAAGVARILLGEASPAGRLPYTMPRSEGQLPLVYDHLPTGRGDDYVDLTGQPLFPFGFGLSYTTFAYSDLRLAPMASAGDTARVALRVRNAGNMASDEVVQLYVRHVNAPTAQPVLALRGFTRVPLQPGEEREVTIPVAVSDLAVRDIGGKRRVVRGDVVVYVGASSRDIRLRGTLKIK